MILTIFFLNFVLVRSNAVIEPYVVHMDRFKMETLDASLGVSRSWQEEVIEFIRISSSDLEEDEKAGNLPELIYPYNTVVCGFSAKLTEKQLQALRSVDGFLWATKDELHTLHTTHSPQFLGLVEGKGMWNPGNLASDVIIGVIDTGIWPEHSSFNDTGISAVPSRWKGKCQNIAGFKASNCNRKLIGAAVFHRGHNSHYEKIDETTNDHTSPRDSDGHGTHTASIAAGTFVPNANIFGMANGTAAGMRPTARIAVYKVCFVLGCADSDILAAIDQAVKDGVDVLSISIGGSQKPYFSDSIAIGAFHAVHKGVIVSFSAGNDGPNSYSVVNVAPWMMTVAASSTDRDFLADVHLGDGTYFSGTSLFSHKPINNIALVYSESGNFCLENLLTRKLVQGKIAICDRGTSSILSKAEEVKRVGGVGMILANARENGEDRFAEPHVFLTVALGASEANIIKKYANISKNPIVSIKFRGTTYNNRAPLVAAFSSRGPSKLDPNILKPDVTAPGINILAAYPPNISLTGLDSDRRRVSFNVLSGTSMACPHVSGVLALLKSVHRDWSTAAIKSALMTTAYVLDSNNSPISDMSDGKSSATPFAFGSGHVDPNKASDPGLIYDISTQDYLNYLCSLKYNSEQMQLFSGTCPAGSRFSPGDLNYPSFSVIFDNQSTTNYKRTVTNVGSSGGITYRANVSKPEGVSITVNPNVLTFKRKGAKLSYNVIFKANRMMRPKASNFSFGDIKWVSEDNKYSVRSPIAVIWQ